MHVYEHAQIHTHTHRDASRNYLRAHTVMLACIIKIKDRKLTTICKEAYITTTPENLHKWAINPSAWISQTTQKLTTRISHQTAGTRSTRGKRQTDRATDEGCKAGAQFQVMPAAPRQSPAEPPGVLRPPSRPSATAARGERPPGAAGGAALAAAARPPPTPARAKCRATGIRAPGWGGKKRY